MGDLFLCGTVSWGDNQCLERLGESYRTQFSSLMKSNCFAGNAELSGKFTTFLTTVLLNGRLQDFVMQDMWSYCSSFITEEQIS
ncbi:hypothetical protein TNCV_1969631 [Trichonephila clavipes]|nr:hypothetical protein TNCV_1969631 [Trichonephila clavipes]